MTVELVIPFRYSYNISPNGPLDFVELSAGHL